MVELFGVAGFTVDAALSSFVDAISSVAVAHASSAVTVVLTERPVVNTTVMVALDSGIAVAVVVVEVVVFTVVTSIGEVFSKTVVATIVGWVVITIPTSGALVVCPLVVDSRVRASTVVVAGQGAQTNSCVVAGPSISGLKYKKPIPTFPPANACTEQPCGIVVVPRPGSGGSNASPSSSITCNDNCFAARTHSAFEEIGHAAKKLQSQKFDPSQSPASNTPYVTSGHDEVDAGDVSMVLETAAVLVEAATVDRDVVTERAVVIMSVAVVFVIVIVWKSDEPVRAATVVDEVLAVSDVVAAATIVVLSVVVNLTVAFAVSGPNIVTTGAVVRANLKLVGCNVEGVGVTIVVIAVDGFSTVDVEGVFDVAVSTSAISAVVSTAATGAVDDGGVVTIGAVDFIAVKFVAIVDEVLEVTDGGVTREVTVDDSLSEVGVAVLAPEETTPVMYVDDVDVVIAWTVVRAVELETGSTTVKVPSLLAEVADRVEGSVVVVTLPVSFVDTILT